MNEEQREHPRYAIALACELSLDGRLLRGQTKDLSRGGISLLLDDPVPVSSAADLSIALVFENDSFSEPLHVKAVIVWCTKLGPRWQIGAKFAKVTRETRTYLDLFLRFLEGDDDEGDEEETPKGRRR